MVWQKQIINKLKYNKNNVGNCRISEQIQIQVDGVQIERVHECKFLGIIIDEKISWKPHINYIQTKLSRSISVLNAKTAKTASGSQFTSQSMLFQSIVLPYFNYCVEIWGNNYISSIDSLTILLKTTTGVINDVCYPAHTHSFFLQS